MVSRRKTEHLTIRVDAVLDALIKARAEDRGLSVSAHVRDIAERDAVQALDVERARPSEKTAEGGGLRDGPARKTPGHPEGQARCVSRGAN